MRVFISTSENGVQACKVYADTFIYHSQKWRIGVYFPKLTKAYDSLLMRRNNVIAEITEKHEKEKDMQRFFEKLKTLDAVEEFDESI